MMEKKKRKTISVKMSMETLEKLINLCDLYGIDQSKIIRTLIDMEYKKNEIFKNLLGKIKKN